MKLFNEPCGMDNSAFITNVQHFSLHDGPGIRTTVFFKGCNLHCQWCHNPETISGKSQVGVDIRNCIGCGICELVCPDHLHSVKANRHTFMREKCQGCGKCVEACPAGALQMYGQEVSLVEIIKKCTRDKDIFPDFGGVTFSGGECLLQADRVLLLAAEMKKRGIHVCVDTALNVPWSVIEPLIAVTDLFLVDIKSGTEETHKRYTNVSNRRIVENLKRLTKVSDCWVRIPVIHGINDTEKEVEAMRTLLGEVGEHLKKIQMLSYHTFGEAKYRCLDLEMKSFEAPNGTDQERMLKVLLETGVTVEWS